MLKILRLWLDSKVLLTILNGKAMLAKKKLFTWVSVSKIDDLEGKINGSMSTINAYRKNNAWKHYTNQINTN